MNEKWQVQKAYWNSGLSSHVGFMVFYYIRVCVVPLALEMSYWGPYN